MNAAADLLLNLYMKDSCWLLTRIKFSGLKDEDRNADDTDVNR